jgi:hypothetical protein
MEITEFRRFTYRYLWFANPQKTAIELAYKSQIPITVSEEDEDVDVDVDVDEDDGKIGKGNTSFLS